MIPNTLRPLLYTVGSRSAKFVRRAYLASCACPRPYLPGLPVRGMPPLTVYTIAHFHGYVKTFFFFFALLFGRPFGLPPSKGLSLLRGFAARSANREWDRAFERRPARTSVLLTVYTIAHLAGVVNTFFESFESFFRGERRFIPPRPPRAENSSPRTWRSPGTAWGTRPSGRDRTDKLRTFGRLLSLF